MVTVCVCLKLKTSRIGCVLNKVGNNSWYFVGVFNKTNYSIPTCWIWDDFSQLGTTCLVGYLPSHIQCAVVELVLNIWIHLYIYLLLYFPQQSSWSQHQELSQLLLRKEPSCIQTPARVPQPWKNRWRFTSITNRQQNACSLWQLNKT